MGKGRKESSDQIDKLTGSWFPQRLQLKQLKPDCFKSRGTSTPMFRGTWIVVNWSTKGYWTHRKSEHNIYGLYRSLFSKREEKKRIKGILCADLFYTYLYIYFSCRLYTTSKKECTKVCYLVHYPTNSIAFACFLKGKKRSNFYLFICSCLYWAKKCFHENCAWYL